MKRFRLASQSLRITSIDGSRVVRLSWIAD